MVMASMPMKRTQGPPPQKAINCFPTSFHDVVDSESQKLMGGPSQRQPALLGQRRAERVSPPETQHSQKMANRRHTRIRVPVLHQKHRESNSQASGNQINLALHSGRIRAFVNPPK